MYRVGTEPAFAALMSTCDEPVKAAFTARPRLSALDVGTDDGSTLWYLHHQLPKIETLVGVDNAPLSEVLRRRAVNGKAPRTTFELYEKWLEKFGERADRALESEDAFNARFSLRYEWDICKEVFDRTYDLVVASHVLHYMEVYDLEDVLAKLYAAMAPEGLIYVSIKQRPASGYGMFNNWNTSMESMRSAADRWGLHQHTILELPHNEGRGFVITNLY